MGVSLIFITSYPIISSSTHSEMLSPYPTFSPSTTSSRPRLEYATRKLNNMIAGMQAAAKQTNRHDMI